MVSNSSKSILLSLFIVCSFTLTAYAADSEEIMTFELGGATNGPGIANKGELLVEEQLFDYQSSFAGRRSYRYDLASTKFRYGLIQDRLEARIDNHGIVITDSQAGFSNTSLGAKIRFLDESKYLPSTELILDFEIPLGRRDLRNPGFDHSYMLVLGKEWIPKWGSIVNLSLDFASYESRSGDVDTAVSIPYAFNTISYNPNPKLNIFTHIFGTWSLTEGFPNPLSVDLGASYAINKDLVFVGWLSKGLNDAAPSLSIDFGLAFRPF